MNIPQQAVFADSATESGYKPIRVHSVFDHATGLAHYGQGQKPTIHDLAKGVNPHRSVLHTAQRLGISLDSVDELLSVGVNRDASLTQGFKSSVAFDADPNFFLHQELVKLLPELVRVERAMPTARTHLPMENLGALGAESFRWQQLDDRAAEAQWAGDYSYPAQASSEIVRRDKHYPLRALKYPARWTFMEMQRIAFARTNGGPAISLNAEKLRMARQAVLRFENRVVMFGDDSPGVGIQGILSGSTGAGSTTSQGIPVNAPLAGAWFDGGSSPEQIRAMMVDAFTNIHRTTLQVEQPDTIALGLDDWLYINTTIFKSDAADSERSIAQVVMDQLRPLGLRQIVMFRELGYDSEQQVALEEKGFSPARAQQYAGGINGKNVMLTFRRDPQKGRIIVGQDIWLRPPQEINDTTTVATWLVTGGFLVIKPLAFDIRIQP